MRRSNSSPSTRTLRTPRTDRSLTGAGQFSVLDIPFTAHDDGVDITLFLFEPLAPTTGSPIGLVRSADELGGKGFQTGGFLGGSIVVSGATGVGDPPAPITLTAYPNPFNPRTTGASPCRRRGSISAA